MRTMTLSDVCVTGGVKMLKSGDFKMLFCGENSCAEPNVFFGATEEYSHQV